MLPDEVLDHLDTVTASIRRGGSETDIGDRSAPVLEAAANLIRDAYDADASNHLASNRLHQVREILGAADHPYQTTVSAATGRMAELRELQEAARRWYYADGTYDLMPTAEDVVRRRIEAAGRLEAKPPGLLPSFGVSPDLFSDGALLFIARRRVDPSDYERWHEAVLAAAATGKRLVIEDPDVAVYQKRGDRWEPLPATPPPHDWSQGPSDCAACYGTGYGSCGEPCQGCNPDGEPLALAEARERARKLEALVRRALTLRPSIIPDAWYATDRITRLFGDMEAALNAPAPDASEAPESLNTGSTRPPHGTASNRVIPHAPASAADPTGSA